MNKTLTYILPLVLLCFISSCRLEEPFVTEQETSEGATIEFVARPTVYDEFNVSTKVTSTEITDLENKIYTAFFMLFDNNGNRVVFKDLTENISSNTVPSQTITPDNGLSNATACFLANVPTAYATSLTTVEHLKGKGGEGGDEGALELYYAQITSECIGIPLLTDSTRELTNVYSLPMSGVYQGDLSALGDYSSTIQIPLERLFSKIIVQISVNIPDDNTSDNNYPQFTLSNFVVNNMPNKVAVMLPEAGVDSTSWAKSPIESDYLTSDNWMSNFNLDNGEDDSETVTTGQGAKSLFFYVPEHMVPRDRDNDTNDQGQKPILVNSDKKPLYVSIKGNLNIPGSSPMIADYNIYLGGNSVDNFNIKRNRIYTNNIIINGFELDHRVEFTHGDVSVLFKRATYLDSHFEVRPLRVKWTGEGTAAGTVTVQVMNAYDENELEQDWVRLERPDDPTSDEYCGTIGKRKYFTTDLVTTTLAESGKSISYPISDDTNGDYPTWVYVDEFISPNDDNSFSDAVRQAKIRVAFTPSPENTESEAITVDYVITQRSVYPVVATNQDVKNAWGVVTGKYTYGIEYFEEYLYDYDRVDVEDLEDGEYATTQNGMEWGLDGVQLSHQHRSVNISELTLSNSLLDDILETLKKYLSIDLKSVITSLVNETIDAEGLPYYDFYIESDNVGENVTKYNYEGLILNKNIIEVVRGQDTEFEKLDLSDTPNSVIQYCYNKNKRDPSTGKVTTLNWYAPAIDEIEDITMSSYDDFDVFQNELYWSCQPAFYLNHVSIPEDSYQIIYKPRRGNEIDASMYGQGNYYTENTKNARATKIYSNEGIYYNIQSGIGQAGIYQNMTLSGSAKIEAVLGWPPIRLAEEPDISTTISPNNEFNAEKFDIGNLPRRGSKNRVRCVYDPEGISITD